MLQTYAAAAGSRVDRSGSGSASAWVHLRAGGVSLLLEIGPAGLPVVRHWGADLGSLDRPDAVAALTATFADGPAEPAYALVPPGGLAGTHDRPGPGPSFRRATARLVGRSAVAPGLTEAGADTVLVEAEDPATGLGLDLAVQLTAAGIVRGRAGLLNKSGEPYRLDALTLLLPAGDGATHGLELADGPVRAVPLRPGAQSVPGRPGCPAQVLVGEPGSGFRRGEVWQAHVAFSGGVTHQVERSAAGRTYLGGGERLAPGEVVLGPGAAYHSPWVHWAWGDGLDAAAARLHTELRTNEPETVPVIFDATAPAFAGHDRAAMLRLAEYAAAVGVETFLVDVDWCVRAGLDPYADREVRGSRGAPDDLAGLLARIGDLDLDLGLAVALEQVDPDSPIARDHPEWLLGVERAGVVGPVLDLSVRGARVYVWERLTKLLDRYPVALLAWSPVSGPWRHAGTLAAYRLLDALRERYPEMIIVSAALDAAMARRAVAADGHTESGLRHAGFAELAQLLPPERIWRPAYDEVEDGSAPGFRAVAAIFGALGLGLDLQRQTPGELRAIHRWLELYAGFRRLLLRGRTVRLDTDDAGFTAYGVVAERRDEALFAVVWRDRSGARRVRLDGLDPITAYRLEVTGPRPADAHGLPAWAGGGAPVLTGRALATVGVALPAARRGSALLLHLTAVS